MLFTHVIHQYTAIHRIQGVSVSHTPLNWIIENQLGRRNLNPNQIAYLRGKRYETEKKIRGGIGANQYTKELIAQNGQLAKNTAQRIADEYGIGRNTVKRNEHFSKVVDILPEEVKSSVLSGNEKITHPETETILKFPKPIQKQFIKEVEKGTPIKEAVKKVDPSPTLGKPIYQCLIRNEKHRGAIKHRLLM